MVSLLHRAAEGPSAQSVSGTRSLMRHRALRVLLSYPNRKWHQNELAQDVDVDPGSHVNRVVRFLLQEHYADYDGRGPGKVISVTRPESCWIPGERVLGAHVECPAPGISGSLLARDGHYDVRGTSGHAGPVCPVQLCMDIRAAGGRYLEQAENLRKEVLRY